MKQSKKTTACAVCAIILCLLTAAALCAPASADDDPLADVPPADVLTSAVGTVTSAETDTTAATEAVTEAAADTTVRVTASSGTSVMSEPLSVPVSYGLRVLAAREEMVLSGLCGNELSLHKDDVCRALNLSAVPGIVLTSLPSPESGTLFVGAVGAAIGQSIPAEALSLVSFAPADADAPCQADFCFTIPGSGYEMTCRLCMLTSVNYTPTVALAPVPALTLDTYCGVPVPGCLSGYDPEGDRMTFEIVSYASHGRVVITDSASGACLYTPDDGYTGSDSFSYVVRDEWGNWSSAADVSVTVSSLPAAVTYADLDGQPCRAAALTVSARGLMNGTRVGGSDYFRPDAPMTRSEFLVTAMNAAGMIPPDSLTSVEIDRALAPFADADDVPDAMKPFYALALGKGTITGRTDADGREVLLPDGKISRAEAAVILSNVIGYAQKTTVSAFADSDALPAWSVPAFTSLRALGILRTPDGAANPSGIMTRGDAAEWLARTLKLIEG